LNKYIKFHVINLKRAELKYVIQLSKMNSQLFIFYTIYTFKKVNIIDDFISSLYIIYMIAWLKKNKLLIYNECTNEKAIKLGHD
jgi:hypothetical protein